MVHLVTGYAGYEHITSADQGSFNAAFFGRGQFVMEAGEQIKASIIDNNTVRVLDGDILMYGRHIRIPPDNYEDITITTGTAGKNRIDLICMTYEKNTLDGTEKAYMEVVKGAETEGIPTMPECVSGNILDGAEKNQMPLYNVTISGVVLSDIACLFRTIPTYKSLAEKYEQEFIQACESHLGALGVIDTMDGIRNNDKGDQLTGALAVKEFDSDVEKALKGKAASSHTHDERYYTETEVNNLLSGKANSSHSHSNYAASSHTHDERYYTETEVNNLLSGKANSSHSHSNYAASSHTHDERYYTETEVNNLLSGKANSSHSHSNYAASNHNHDDSYLSLNGGNLKGDISIPFGKNYNWATGAGFRSVTGQHLEIRASTEEEFRLTLGVMFNTWTLTPNLDNSLDLGTAYTKWKQIYSTNSIIFTSDRNQKQDIEPISDKYIALFSLLQPVIYRFKNGSSGRIHIGFIAQDVEDAMAEVGLSDLDFAGFCKDKKQREVRKKCVRQKMDDVGNLLMDESGNPIMEEYEDIIYEDDLDSNGNPIYIYALRYEEFIALNTAMIQQLQKKVGSLEQRIGALENIIKSR